MCRVTLNATAPLSDLQAHVDSKHSKQTLDECFPDRDAVKAEFDSKKKGGKKKGKK